MPYSNYAVSDRQAVSQFKYQAKRFIRQMSECGTDRMDIERISNAIELAILEASASVDFHDDGTRMEDCQYGPA